MSVRVFDNHPQIRRDAERAASLFLRFFSEETIRRSTPKTPMRHNFLRREILKQVLGLHGAIKWLARYSVFQETKQFQNYTTPGTGPHFAENAVRSAVKDTAAIARKAKLTT